MITFLFNPLVRIASMEFSDWIVEQLNSRGWSQADLARASKLTRGSISNYVNGRVPDNEALKKIAHAFRLPISDVFQAANALPPDPGYVPDMGEWIKIFTDAPDDETRKELLFQARNKAEYEQRKKGRPPSENSKTLPNVR